MLGSQTDVVNGSRFTTPQREQYNPLSYGVQTTGVPQVSPVIPPFLGQGGAVAGASSAGAENVGGYGTAGNNAQMAAIANANPFHIKVSPTLWLVGFLVVSLTLLNMIHWRKTTLGSVHIDGHAGPGHASTGADAGLG